MSYYNYFEELAHGACHVYTSDDFTGGGQMVLIKGYESPVLAGMSAGDRPDLVGGILRFGEAGSGRVVDCKILKAEKLANSWFQLTLDQGVEGIDGDDGVIFLP